MQKLELYNRIDKLEDKVDKLADMNAEQNVLLGKMEVMFEKQQEILEEHQRRSLASEKRHEFMEDKFTKHLSFLKGVGWVFSIAMALLSAYAILVKTGLI